MNQALTKGRAIRVKFHPPTNMSGARVGIYDTYFKERKALAYDYEIGDIVRQAQAFLAERGFEIEMFAETEKEYLLFVRGFEWRLQGKSESEKS